MENGLKSDRLLTEKPKMFALFVTIGLTAHLALVWAWPYPPLLDWPNHMARHYLEAMALAGDPLPKGYEIHYALIPNLGGDLVVPVLLQVFSVSVASRVFLSFCILICWLGFGLFVGRQAARCGYGYAASLLILPWLLTQSFFVGFLNYTSGLGLAFLAFYNYLRLSENNRLSRFQLMLHGALVVLLYIWHLAALGVYLVLFASHFSIELLVRRSGIFSDHQVRCRFIMILLTLAPVTAVLITQKLMTSPVAIQGAASWRSPADKVAIAFTTLLSYNHLVDVGVIAFWLAAIVFMVRIESMRLIKPDWLLLAFSIFFILYLALPEVLGSTSSVDTRVLVPLLICFIALVARLPPRHIVSGALLALIATLLRIGGIAQSWEAFERVDAQHLAFIRSLPVGTRILGLQIPNGSRFKNDDHFIAWAVPERQAMVSSLFSIPGQQPLRVSVNTIGPFMHFTDKVFEIDADRVHAAAFDYVWYFNAGDLTPTVPLSWRRVYTASSIKIWQVH